tara:strand:+ start:3123 stop:3602 length:480 start_codon:yes stop_codon:yes gene_type:complete
MNIAKNKHIVKLDPLIIKQRLFYQAHSIKRFIVPMKGCEGITVDYVQLPYTLTKSAVNLLKLIQRFDKAKFFNTTYIEKIINTQLATCDELSGFELSDFRTNVIAHGNDIGVTMGRPIYDKLKEKKGVERHVNAAVKTILSDRICALSWTSPDAQQYNS